MPFYKSEDVQERIESPDNLPARIQHHDIKKGKTPGAKDIPMPIKKVIAITAQSDSLDNTAEAFGISRREVGFLKAGSTSGGPNEELQKVIDNQKQDAADKAIQILTEALGILPDKLNDKKIKAKEVSSVAKDMAQVHETLRKKSPIEQSNIQFHVWAPKQKVVEDYEVIDV